MAPSRVPPPPTPSKPRSHKRRRISRANDIAAKRVTINNKRLNAGPHSTTPTIINDSSPPIIIDVESTQGVSPAPGTVRLSTSVSPHSNLTKRTNKIRLSQVAILTDTSVFGWLRRHVMELIDDQDKPVKTVSHESVKRDAINYFPSTLSYASAPTAGRSRSQSSRAGLATTITQDDLSQGAASVSPDDSTRTCLPHSTPSHATIESLHYRRYLLEDVLYQTTGCSLLIVVSTHHLFFRVYKNIADVAPPLPLHYHRGATFIQLKATVVKNSSRDDLISSNLLKVDFNYLLFGNGNGAIGLHFVGTDTSIEVQ